MPVFPVVQQPHRIGSQPPPYLEGGIITHQTGAFEGCSLDVDHGARVISVPVEDIHRTPPAPPPAPSGRALGILIISDDAALTCDLDQVANGLGGLDKGAKANQTAYECRLYASRDGVAGLMAVETGTVPTIPAGIVWRSPILAALITDDAGACKPFADLRQGWQQWTGTFDGSGALGPLSGTRAIAVNNAGPTAVTLTIANAGDDPCAVVGVRQLKGALFVTTPTVGNANAVLLYSTGSGRLVDEEVDARRATVPFRAAFADALVAAPHLDVTATGDGSTFGDLAITEIRLDW